MDERENNTCEVPYSKLIGSNRLLTEDEAKNEAKPGAIAWVELKKSNFVFCVLTGNIPYGYFNYHYYGRLWRLWAEEPSEALRERTEWDELGGAETET